MANEELKFWSILHRVKKTSIEMMTDRGYTVHDETLLEYSVEKFRKFFLSEQRKAEQQGDPQEQSTIHFLLSTTYTREEPKDKVLIWFTPFTGRDVIVEDVRDFIAQLDLSGTEDGPRHGIIISDRNLGSSPASYLSDESDKVNKLLDIEHFTFEDLVVNPTRHFLVDKHEKITTEESKALFKNTNLKVSQLPLISIRDPQVRYYHFLPGNIVRIHRINLNGRKEIFFRKVDPT
jgi:DNA-directed RNA polymerase I, II, and III subunit RPABC1